MKYLWYTDTKNKKSPDFVHQVLAFGTLRDIQALRKTMGVDEIKNIFLKYPKKIYTSPLLNFVKNIFLNINTIVDEKKYLKNIPRSS